MRKTPDKAPRRVGGCSAPLETPGGSRTGSVRGTGVTEKRVRRRDWQVWPRLPGAGPGRGRGGHGVRSKGNPEKERTVVT